MKRDEEYHPSQLHKAYVMIACQRGTEEELMSELESMHVVKQATRIFGICDVLARLETRSLQELRDTVSFRIRESSKVRSLDILMCMKALPEILTA